ncbi:hypothetical protein [Tropicibacter oceani]|uniref:Uncharacterized protein n=1 Tax=Tropicibacter oceani TaxID=3058420 RepID=A0ABY8QHL4_9RHOB|nr:hypothetical protein [Tropicibacter oceani]WGW04139.1 hypothetical protein QF118_00950 [Tropicibacter oceani]
MLRNILLPATLAWSAFPALAQDCSNPIFAVREDGVPYYYHPDPDTYQRVLEYVVPRAGAKDEQPLDRPIVAIDLRKGRAGWISRDEIGYILDVFEVPAQQPLVYKGPEHCRPRDIAWEFDDPSEPGREPIALPDGRPIPEPIDLFAEEPSGPRSGLWRAEIGKTTMEGCPPMMQSAFPASAGALPGLTSEARRMEFADPFHPDSLEMSRTTGVRWQGVGDNQWRTEDMAAEAFGQIPQGEGGGSRLVWTLKVLSPEEMSFERAIEIVLPDAAAAMMGVGPDGCRVFGTDRWVRVGD